MKLEIKHLAPYLPYRIKAKWVRSDDQSIQITELTINDYPFLINKQLKPILRPLSDLTEKIQIAEHFCTFKEHCQNAHPFGEHLGFHELETNPLDYDYHVISFLFKWHFDVFGLIDAGLAIDINTLDK